MTDRSFRRRAAAAGLTAALLTAGSARAEGPDIGGAGPRGTSVLAERVMDLTRGTTWNPTGEIALDFPTFHPQGMVRIGDAFFISSVEIIRPTTRYDTPREGYDRDEGEGRGHLFRVGADGRLTGSVVLGEGAIYHPGGIDFDGTHLWVPVAEYRPDSASIVYRVDPATMEAEAVFRFADHIGGVAFDTDSRTLHGVSWGSRRFYAWPLAEDGTIGSASAGPADPRTRNPAQYIDYQDCKYAGGGSMLCTGLNAYRTSPDAAPFRLGGMELVDLADGRPIWQVPVELWAPSGLPMTQNPAFLETSEEGLRAYFMPDDDASTIFVYDVSN